MSTMVDNYNVYVSASYLGARDNKSLSTSKFSFVLNVMTSYLSDAKVMMSKRFDTWESFNAARSMAREIKNLWAQQSFHFPSQSLTSDDGTPSSLSWDTISKMISDMNIPFSLDKLQWRGNPREDWIPLRNRDDIIIHILDIVRRKRSTVSAADCRELTLHVSIKKEIILPHHEFEAMVNTRRADEAVRDCNAVIAFMTQQQISLGRPLLRSTWESMSRHPLREMGINLRHNSLDSLIDRAIRESAEQPGCKPIPAAKSSIEALEEEILEGHDLTGSCAICMEILVIGSSVTSMPCSHKFHKNCIVRWLEKSHLCPLCRFKLPTT